MLSSLASSANFTPAIEFFTKGGIFMWPLLACSVVALSAIIFKFLTVRKNAILPDSLESTIERAISISNPDAAHPSHSSVTGRLCLLALENANLPADQLSDLVEARARHEFTRLQNGIPLLEMITQLAPMFGILGTATGLVSVFGSFGSSASQDGIALGIAEALNTTISGLAIAAPALVGQMFFSRKLERFSARVESLLAGYIACVTASPLADSPESDAPSDR